MISSFFIDRPVFATVIAILILLAGAASIPILPIAQFPDIVPPSVTISTAYPGANAEVVEQTVTNAVEQQVNGVEGMIYMTSTSANNGSMVITLTFDVGYDLDLAAINTENRAQIAVGQLPSEVVEEGLITTKQSPDTMLYVSLISPSGQYDTLFLSNYADLYITNQLKRIPGVGDVGIMGERLYAMRIWLDPNRMASLGISTSDVASAVEEQNIQVPAGAIGESPAPPGQELQYTVSTLGRLSLASQFGDIILRTQPDGSIVRIKDVARVELGAEDYGTHSDINGMPAVTISINQFPDANAMDVAGQVKEVLRRVSARFPEGIEYRIVYDLTRFIKASITEVLWTLVQALALVFAVVILFLRDWRSTLIPVLTIPVALVGSFALLNVFGLTINTLTLFGIVLAVGLVVDDAIIVVENVSRHLSEKRLSSAQAAKLAMSEVTAPVIATTLVLMAVFIPVGFTPGITGTLYKQFALTVACAVGISAINALTLSPALCAILLRSQHASGHGGSEAWIDRGFRTFTSIYERIVRAFLRRRRLVLALFVSLLGGTYVLFRTVPTGFIPNEDQGLFVVIAQLPEGASQERTLHVSNEIEEILRDTPGVQSTLSIITSNNSASVYPVLAPWSQRADPELHVDAIIHRVQKQFASIQDAIVIAVNPPPIPGLGSTGGFEFELQDVTGGDLRDLKAQADQLINKGNATPGLAGLYTLFQINTPQLFVNLDRTKTLTQDIPLSDVFDALQIYLGGLYINDFNKFGRIYKVFMQAEADARSDSSDISRLYVNNANGDSVPLSTLLQIRRLTAPQSITHYNTYRSVSISGEAAPGYSSSEAVSAMEKLAKDILPPSMNYAWTGTTYQQIQAGNVAPLLFALSLVLVFLLLAAQYESWSAPLVIMLAVPLAILGALAAQWLRGLENDLYCQVGFMMLIGLASKNAILIVEFARRRRMDGLSLESAALEAARIRLRPILMTSLAFILGVSPLVLASGAGAASRQSLGTAVFGGMIAATALSLFFVPVFFVGIERLRQAIIKQ